MVGVEVVDIFTAIGQDAMQAIQPVGAAQVSKGGGLAVLGDVLAAIIHDTNIKTSIQLFFSFF